MKEGFRQSMAWLHTWSGLLVGWVLFMVFVTGTSAYFREEISFWMRPELHLASRGQTTQTEAAERAVATLQQRGAQSPRWFIDMPTAREPGLRLLWNNPPKPAAAGAAKVEPPRRVRFESATLDPATGEVLVKPRETRGGDFFYRLHFDLHYMPAVWGRWIVGICAMFMLVAILSGVVTHKRIFVDFFTFRMRKGQRSWLDAHNVTAVLALPYHLMITYTGLVTLMFLYMPWAPQIVYKGDQRTYFAEVFPSGTGRAVKAAGEAAPLTPIAGLIAQAGDRWGEGSVARIIVNNPNDANASVTLTRQDVHSLSSEQASMTFNGVTGAPTSSFGDTSRPAAETRGVLYGLHLGRFSNPLLRWLFFVSGVLGCIMVATGLLLWSVKERQKYAKALARGGRIGFGLRLVDGLNIAAVAGLPLAMAAYFWANRLLPVGMAERPDAEIGVFFAVWGVAALAGLAWPVKRMWQIVLALGGAAFAGVPLLNLLTTASHLGVSLPLGLWKVAAFDLACLALGAALLWAVWWLGRRKPQKVAHRAPPAPAANVDAGLAADAGAA